MSQRERDFYHFVCDCEGCDVTGRDKLKTCSDCTLISYCSVEHQKRERKNHKGFCGAVKSMLKSTNKSNLFEGQKLKTPKLLFEFQAKLVSAAQRLLGRELSRSEKTAIDFPNICALCFSPNRKDLVACTTCNAEYYCCMSHKLEDSSNHKDKSCAQLKLALDFHLNMTSSVVLAHEYESLVSPTVDSFHTDFPSDMSGYMNYFIPQSNVYAQIAFSEALSFVLSICYSLKMTEFSLKPQVTVHVVGADATELSAFYFLDVFHVWNPSVEFVRMLLIGPDVPHIKKEEPKHCVDSFPLLYHDWLDQHGSPDSPDVIVAFNSGFHSYNAHGYQNSWLPTLKLIFQSFSSRSLFIFTSYTHEEAQSDNKIVMDFVKKETKRIADSLDNPFKSMKPLRNPERNDAPIFYINNYISVYDL